MTTRKNEKLEGHTKRYGIGTSRVCAEIIIVVITIVL